jgi:hypothetical protein
MVFIVFVVGKDAFTAYFFSASTQGQVVEHSSKLSQTNMIGVSGRRATIDEILVEYEVDGQPFWILVNSHVYSAIGIIEQGDTLTVAYDKDYPEQGYVMSYALFTRFTSILLPFILLIFIALPPQWVYHYKKYKQEQS